VIPSAGYSPLLSADRGVFLAKESSSAKYLVFQQPVFNVLIGEKAIIKLCFEIDLDNFIILIRIIIA